MGINSRKKSLARYQRKIAAMVDDDSDEVVDDSPLITSATLQALPFGLTRVQALTLIEDCCEVMEDVEKHSSETKAESKPEPTPDTPGADVATREFVDGRVKELEGKLDDAL